MMRTLHAHKVAGSKSKDSYSSTVESMLWRITGPSAYQLQESMLKND